MKLESHATRAALEWLASALEPLTELWEDRDAFEDALVTFIYNASQSGIMVSYDWINDVASRRSEASDPTALQAMDLDTFQRTVISHIRGERLVEGHLRALARSGYLTAMAARARTLAATL